MLWASLVVKTQELGRGQLLVSTAHQLLMLGSFQGSQGMRGLDTKILVYACNINSWMKWITMKLVTQTSF